jgi:hypothetical protein
VAMPEWVQEKIPDKKIQEKMYPEFSLSKNHSGNGDFFY